MPSLPKQNQKTEYRNRAQLIEKIRQLDSIAFERFVTSLFNEIGYEVQATSESGGEGVDFVLRKGKKRAIVQCNRYENSIDQSVIEDLYRTMVRYKADEAYLVTTGMVTGAAKQWAKGKPLHLIDEDALIKTVEAIRAKRKKQKTKKTKQRRSRSLSKNSKLSLIASLVWGMVAIFCLCGICIGSFSVASLLAATSTPTFTSTFTSTFTLTPTSSPTSTDTPTPTVTSTFTSTSTSTLIPTLTPTSTRTYTPKPTATLPPTMIPRPAQPSHPPGATAICRDGTYSYSKSRRGTCSHHGGVWIWLRR